MCFVWKHGSEALKKGELTTDEWKDIFRQVPKSAIITFTGGEPFVRKDLPELLKAACENHRVHLVSNGTMFRDSDIEECIDMAPRSMFGKGLISIGVSLEGPESVHDAMVKVPGSYRRTTETLKTLAELKKKKGLRFPLLDLKIVICRETMGSMVALYDLAEDLGLDIISYQQCSTQESSYGIDSASGDARYKAPSEVETIPREELINEMNALIARGEKGRTTLRFNPEMPVEYFAKRYENRFPLKDFTCSAAWSIMHIGPYGTVYPCFSLPMGSLRDQKLTDIWNGREYRDFRQAIRKSQIFPGCIGCCVMKMKGKSE